MPKYRVERRCYFQERLFDPEREHIVNLNLDPEEVPNHFTCLDPPKKASRLKKGEEATESQNSSDS